MPRRSPSAKLVSATKWRSLAVFLQRFVSIEVE